MLNQHPTMCVEHVVTRSTVIYFFNGFNWFSNWVLEPRIRLRYSRTEVVPELGTTLLDIFVDEYGCQYAGQPGFLGMISVPEIVGLPDSSEESAGKVGFSAQLRILGGYLPHTEAQRKAAWHYAADKRLEGLLEHWLTLRLFREPWLAGQSWCIKRQQRAFDGDVPTQCVDVSVVSEDSFQEILEWIRIPFLPEREAWVMIDGQWRVTNSPRELFEIVLGRIAELERSAIRQC